MTSNLRYFSVKEAEEKIPLLNEIFEKALALRIRIEEKIEHWRREKSRLSAAEEALVRGQVDFLAVELDRLMETIVGWGALPKDWEAGLVDFPTRINGREVYLCWKNGETKIRYYHGLTEGYRGRRLIPQKGQKK